jgi:hypothetical protein
MCTLVHMRSGAAPVGNLVKCKTLGLVRQCGIKCKNLNVVLAPLYQWLFYSVKTKFLYLMCESKFCIIVISTGENGL